MSATEAGNDHGAAILVTRLFTEALDARDLAALRVLVADDVEFRNREAGTLRGWDVMTAVVEAAKDSDMFEVCDKAVSAFEVLT